MLGENSTFRIWSRSNGTEKKLGGWYYQCHDRTTSGTCGTTSDSDQTTSGTCGTTSATTGRPVVHVVLPVTRTRRPVVHVVLPVPRPDDQWYMWYYQ
jgi:hypothetical protein